MIVDNHQNHIVDKESIKRTEHISGLSTNEDDHRMSDETVNKEQEEHALLVSDIYGKDLVDEEIIAFESGMPDVKNQWRKKW